MKKYTSLVYSLIAILLLLQACRRDEDYSSWETNMLTPIASSSLSINDLMKDSVLGLNPDSSLLLVYDQTLYASTVDDIFVVPDTEIRSTLTLERLKLSDRTLTQSIKLSTIFPAAVLLDGQTVTVPAQNFTSAPPTPIDGSTFFQTAVLKEGYMDISIANGFPVDLEKMVFRLINKVTGDELVYDSLSNITSGSSKMVTADLAGKKVDASMEVQVISIKTYATPSPVLVRANDACEITITVRDLHPLSATAVFPSQSVYGKDENALYNFNGAELKKLRIKSGRLVLRIVSTIQEKMTVHYSIPHAVKNGNSVDEIMTVIASAPGKSTEVKREIDLHGYTIDLRGKNPAVDDTVNAFWNVLDVTIDSSGRQTSISLQDSVYIYYGLLDIEPEWAEGYFGKQVLQGGANAANFDLFKNASGSIDLDDIAMAVRLSNGIGADAEIDVKSITSVNTRNGQRVNLNATPLNNKLNINPAIDNPFSENVLNIGLDKTNSNVEAFIENLPDRIEYNMDVTTNPFGNIRHWKDFLYDFSTVKASLRLTMPLALTANNLRLGDTLPFEMFSTGSLNRVKEGTFNIIIDNSFPLSASLQLYIVNDAGQVVDSIMNLQNNTINAGVTDPNTGKVIAPVRSVVKAYFTRERMEKVKSARRLLVMTTFNTPANATQPTKIYSNYKFDIKLTGDFVYEQRF